MGEVTPGVERHAEQALVAELVAQRLPVGLGELVDVLRLHLREVGRLDAVGEDRPERDEVGVDARVRLHVGVRGTEQLARVLGGQRLDGVDVLAAGVEAVTDRALGVLVAEPGAHRQQHRRRGVVLRGDQLERTSLVGELLAGGVRDARLDLADHLEGLGVRAADQGVGHDRQPRARTAAVDPQARTGASRVTWTARSDLPRLTDRMVVSHCGAPSHDTRFRLVGWVSDSLRLLDMVSASTHTHLVVRRHVDLDARGQHDLLASLTPPCTPTALNDARGTQRTGLS